ncbi:MAG: s-methyl-5-thioribose-1-phosphate isomerase [Lachnospiraceae bacterium]|uniref:s-methyl-5-thioribose-1-phosphate isomerase n=1 Tax=Parablautia sp. Marseille-Q6255 TaxID=3039593 RepID=UPI002F41D0F4
MIERVDKNLAFMLQYENVAWYENGSVKILDRRIYPLKVEFVTCYTHQEVAQAIKDMVTQSAGPYLAAGMGMALAAWECRNLREGEQIEYLKNASRTLSNARSTTAVRMAAITEKCIATAKRALSQGVAVDQAIFEHSVEEVNNKYIRISKTAEYLVDMFPDKGAVLTQCFGETIVGFMLKEMKKRSKDMKVICAETRPYFQGARLTASVAYDQGFDVTVITDNMPAFAMQNGMVDVFTSAADAISCDGHIVNKIGTLQLAIVCKHYGIPYFVTGAPDAKHPTIDSVKIEYRDEKQVLEAMGIRTTKEGIKGWYPAFDITPPYLCDGIVTNKGIYAPYDIKRYFQD